MKKALKIFVIVLVSIIILLTAGFFIFRNQALEFAINKAKQRFKDKYQCTLIVQNAEISGLSDLTFKNIYIIPENNDTLFHCTDVATTVKLFHIFLGDVRLSTLNILNTKVNLHQYDTSNSNFSAFLKSEPKGPAQKEVHEKDFAEVAYDLINQLLDHVPSELKIENTGLAFNRFGNVYGFTLQSAILDNGKLASLFDIYTPSNTQRIQANGEFEPSDMTGNVNVHALTRAKMTVPWVDEKYKLKLGADELQLKLNSVEMDGGELSIKCFASYNGLLINHVRLADHDISVSYGSGSFDIQIGKNYIALDSTSKIQLNKISCYPYARFQAKPETALEIKLRTDRIASQEFFNSLPQGMFESLNGIRTEGFLTYNMSLNINDTNPWAATFDSELKPESFKILSYGLAMLPKLNSTFTYTPYEYGRPQRPIVVGYENPSYVAIEEVSPYIKNAILTSEDPSFYSHRGFVMEALRQSLSQNWVSHRFARGGSTISMQLVKNISLSRKKTLARKFEEMLLVWLIENQRISSKSRMFEVYLNIIEWGPNIYGVGEATRFYFSKSPAQVTLPEAIFLAGIIPRPKGFAWNFNDSTASVKHHFARYMQHMSKRMATRKLIEPTDTSGFVPDVYLKGPARSFLKKYKNMPADSLSEVEEPVIPEFSDDMIEQY